MTNPNTPELEPLSRNQILIFMGITAILLLAIAKVWQKLGAVQLLSVDFSSQALLWSLGLAIAITLTSGIIYRLWPAYRRSADMYLELVIKPLIWTDLIWLGLLPGLSEELLFRGVMLPALGLNLTAVAISSVLFGVLHLSGNGQWPYVVWAGIVGFALGYCALITGNLVVPVVAHIITNLVSGTLWKINYWQKQKAESGIDE
ncbi:MAG: CPBP family intramembrane glutamic endopeptidase [Cyanobacteria bacterium P01_G01_bin.39]